MTSGTRSTPPCTASRRPADQLHRRPHRPATRRRSRRQTLGPHPQTPRPPQRIRRPTRQSQRNPRRLSTPPSAGRRPRSRKQTAPRPENRTKRTSRDLRPSHPRTRHRNRTTPHPPSTTQQHPGPPASRHPASLTMNLPTDALRHVIDSRQVLRPAAAASTHG